MDPALGRILTNLNNRIRQLEGLVAATHDEPGYKHPYFGVVNISVPASITTISGNFPIDPSGPYTLVGLAAFWRQTSQAQFRPISHVIEPDDATPDVNALSFEWELEIMGTNYKMQEGGIPSSALFSNIDRPHYLPVPITIKGNSGFKVTVTPIATPVAAGTLYFVFIGYKTYDRNSDAPSVETIPAAKLPYIAVLDVDAPATTANQTQRYDNGQDGPFVVTAISAAYRVTSQETVTGYRPISSLWDNQVASPASVSPNFLWRIRTTGNDLFWSNDMLPSPLLFSSRERPLYLPVPAIISPGSALIFEMNPIIAAPSAGTIHINLHGYVPLIGGAL